MKTIALTATAALVALGAAGAAQAQTTPYASLGGTYLFDSEIPAATGRFGADIGQNFGLEAEGSLGLDGSEPALGVEQDLDHILAGFARLRAPLGSQWEGFVRGGYYTSQTTVTAGGVATEIEDDDFAAGAGVQYNLSERSGIRADYTNYGLTDDGHAGTLSFVQKF